MPAPSLVVEPLSNPGKFLDIQRRFYRGDPNYVPPLTFLDKSKIDRRNHPFFEHADVGLFVARRGPETVGRISVTRDRLHDEFHGDRIGFFGHFEAADEPSAHALLDHASSWLRDRGADALRGPIDFSTNYRCGLLIEGEPGPPVMMMPHQPASYRGYLESFGLEKAKDLLALRVLAERLDLRRLERVTARLMERQKLSLRSLDKKRFDDELQTLWSLYTRIWETNWGFAPMTEAEFRAEANDLKKVLVPELTNIIERDGEPIAFSIGVPNINIGIKACKGRLFPFGWWRFLRAMRPVHSFRMLTLGVLPEVRKTGMDGTLLCTSIHKGLRAGYDECEASWILEDNLGMVKPLMVSGAELFRRYRVYEKPLR